MVQLSHLAQGAELNCAAFIPRMTLWWLLSNPCTWKQTCSLMEISMGRPSPSPSQDCTCSHTALRQPSAKTSARDTILFSLSQSTPFIFPVGNCILCIRSYFLIDLNTVSGAAEFLISSSSHSILGLWNTNRWLCM